MAGQQQRRLSHRAEVLGDGVHRGRLPPRRPRRRTAVTQRKAWQLQSKLATYVYPPQKLVAKVRAGAKVSDNHDQATTLFQHAIDHPTVTVQQTYSLINPQSAPGRWTLIRWGPAGSLVLRITLCRVSELPARRSPRSNARDRCQAGTRTSWVSIRSATKKVSKPACVR